MGKSTMEQGIPLIGPILNRIIGTRNDRFVKKYTQRVEAINALEAEIRILTDDQIRNRIHDFRARIEKGERAGDLLIEAFAVAREAMDRAVGIRNIFNPKFAERFDPSQLPAEAREMYDRIKAQVDATPPLLPITYDARKNGQPAANALRDEKHEFRGCSEIVPGYLRVEIPPALYEAVRAIYPKSKPPFRARPFDVQLIGGMVLSNGKIAEMRTGEGKTIVGPLACYLACVENLKVHVVTVNDYLVQRDRDWTFPYFHALGLTVGAIHPMHMQDEGIKRQMYHCDVVYGTTAEFGFDYLRDNMKRSVDQQVQKAREFAVVDEVDSTLIDEARTPLIISGPAHEDAPRYDIADRLARHLVQKQRPWQQADDAVQQCTRNIKGLEGDIRNANDKGKVPALQSQVQQFKGELPRLEAERKKYVQYYEIELDKKKASLTHEGIAEAQRIAGVGSFYVGENVDLPHRLEQALRAHVVYQLDRDYIVMPTENPQTGRQEPGIVIVDTNTGRPMIGRQWSDGLHQAIEAKEAVPIKQETQTVATITIQNFFKMYKRLAGMTGTADTEAQEFHDIYKLDVVAIPTNLPVVRRDFDDMVFLTGKDKWDFIVDEIKAFHDVGRPVLVGTTSVEKSETLSRMLTAKHGIKHEVLNAKQHERESLMIENAGQIGAVMIATNMAGRGTDIKLGAISREAQLDHWLRRGICSRELTVNATEQELRENVYRKIGAKELDLPKHEIEKMEFQDLERKLLMAWATKYTWLSGKHIDTFTADQLRDGLDRNGRFLLHRLRWFESIEDMGGLHVVGTERHESRRIDNQLRGRAGRQGDRGSSRFFVSLQDELMMMFMGDKVNWMLSKVGMKEGDAIENPMLSKQIERVQRKVEERNFMGRKQILDYDEVMEHQRQGFYGLRQRVLEGRDVRGLLDNYIRDTVRDAVAMYLNKNYAAECGAEFVRQTLDVNIEPDRLRGLEGDDLERRIRADAQDEAREQIAKTIGEYLPQEGSEFEVDFDAEGLARWARSHFGVELSPDDLRATGAANRREIMDKLDEAAQERIAKADLSGLQRFADKHYGVGELINWARNKFDIELDREKVIKSLSDERNAHATIESLIVKEAQALSYKREVEYPVDFVMNVTMQMMRQNPGSAMQQFIGWANQRYNLGWTPEFVMKTPPSQCREILLDASRKFVESGELRKLVDEAVSKPDWDSLTAFFKERFNATLPEDIKRLKDQDRADAIRARVESILRGELLYFEKTMLLETLDPTWKDHLYTMDQLRDAIGFRAFSQQDPKIEYKREGSKLFSEMMESVREKVTDMVFKLDLKPQVQATPAAGVPRPAGMPAPSGSVQTLQPPTPGSSRDLYGSSAPVARPASGTGVSIAGLGGMGGITGPGLDTPSSPTNMGDAAVPMSERQQRDLEAAQRAGTGGDKSQPVNKAGEKRFGRNDTCTCGSGRKYKKCCNKADGTCNGQGLNNPAGDDENDD